MGERSTAYGLDTVQRKLKAMGPTYKRVIIQCGINDMENNAKSVVERKISAVFETAKQFLPKSEIFITSIINRDGTAALQEINSFIQAQAHRFQYKYIDTSNLSGRPDLFRDRKHPNERCTGQIVSKIKEAIGLRRSGGGYRHMEMNNRQRDMNNNLRQPQMPYPVMPQQPQMPIPMMRPQQPDPRFQWGISPRWN